MVIAPSPTVHLATRQHTAPGQGAKSDVALSERKFLTTFRFRFKRRGKATIQQGTNMTRVEIESAYAASPPDEAFEAFDAANVDNATIAEVLGQEAAQEYASWIYANLK